MSLKKTALAAGALFLMTLQIASTEPVANTTIVNPDDLYDPAPNGYSHAVVSTDIRAMVHIAGQGGEDHTGALSPHFDNQVAQAYANLSVAITASGARPDQVTKITTYVVGYDPSMLAVMTHHLVGLFGDHLPAQTLVPVPRLALDGMLFEVDAVAALSD